MVNKKKKAVKKNQKYNKFLNSKIIQKAVIADLRNNIVIALIVNIYLLNNLPQGGGMYNILSIYTNLVK